MKFLTAFLMVSAHIAMAQNHPILHIPFEESAQSLGMLPYEGTLHGATIQSDASVGAGAVFLDGKDDYISFPEGVYFSGAYSIALWVKPMSTSQWIRFLDFNQDEPASGCAVTWLIGRHDKGNDMWFDQWIMYDDRPVESILDFTNKHPADAYLDYDVRIGEWHHFVLTYLPDDLEGTTSHPTNSKGETVPLNGVVKLYVDGTFRSSTTYCLNPQPEVTTANWLGRSRYESDPYYHGFMDDFRIYDCTLTEGEVLRLYKLSE